MTQVSKYGWSAYGVAALVIALDQAVKSWIVNGLKLADAGSVPVIGPLRFTWVMNLGTSYGLLKAHNDLGRWGLVLFSVIVAVMICWWARRSHRTLQALGYGLVAGGAVGNAIDRARLGFVIDFIDVERLGFFPWVFNLADSAISIGVVALLLDSLRREHAA